MKKSFLNVYQRRNKKDLTGDNQRLPSTPAKSTPLSHICDESLVISTPLSKRVSFAVSIPDEESATMYNASPLSESKYNVISFEKGDSLRLNSPIYAETLNFAPPQEDIETVTHPQCYGLNAKLIESLSVFATSALRDNKRKASGHNYVETPKKKKRKKKKVYWPKVKGQMKRKTTPKVPNESKTKREHVFIVNGDNKNYKRTQESKSRKESKEGASKVDEDKFNRTNLAEVQDELISTPKEDIISKKGPLHSKRESCKRSLTFEPKENFEKPLPVQDELKGDSLRESYKRSLIFQPEENYEKPLHMQDELDELGFKGDSLTILSCPLLTKIRRMKLKIPRRKRSKIQKKRTQYRELLFLYIKERELPFQWNKKRKRSYYAKRKINLDSLTIICNLKRKRMKKAKKAEANDERKAKARRKMKIPTKTMKDLIKEFQSLNITMEVPYQNKDRRLLSYKGIKKGRGVKVNTELISYCSQNGVPFPYKGKVKLDLETSKEWNLLMHGKSHDDDEGNREYWEQERSIFSGRVDAFIACMHNFLGNRSFLPWKGSVLDSVIGVFLTQNVSDHLSSSAYMCLASTFPIKTFSEERKDNIPLLKHENSSQSCTANNSLNLGNKNYILLVWFLVRKSPLL
ncbi:hypothetical protein K1719_041295 [Acacia pycnantha]|nr:hypothetical protein K1719_041295 [Acacia pycnantha]